MPPAMDMTDPAAKRDDDTPAGDEAPARRLCRVHAIAAPDRFATRAGSVASKFRGEMPEAHRAASRIGR